MILETVVIGLFQANAYVLGCEETREAVIIDTGESGAGILEALEEKDLKAKYILLTHGHVDHAGGLRYLKEELEDVEILMHPGDQFLLEHMPEAALLFGVRVERPPQVDRYLKEGDEVRFGVEKLKVIATPGHTPGGISFYSDGSIFVGDTLFQGSIGRTDLPGGSYGTLIDSIKKKILPLGDDVVVYSGHGPVTTVGFERRHNPFL
jgi:glyoxylase-like metal-dependent hydrolase (beta-lactamase superfamily II)